MFQDILEVKSALLHSFCKRRVLVVGDVMLDKYQWGKATRLSPEAPVPVISLERETATLGGAANVASNLASLQVQVELAGFIGSDLDSQAIRTQCKKARIGVKALVGLDSYRTTTKTRIIADERQLLRIDDEATESRSPSETNALFAAIDDRLGQVPFDALIISDYAKGVCSPDFCGRLIARCRVLHIPVYVDPKGQDYCKYAGATAIKPNSSEIGEIAEVMGWPSTDRIEASRLLLDFLHLDFVALTLGAEGMALVCPNSVHALPTAAREVFDVSGAGDTVIATMVAALSSGVSLLDSLTLANTAAAEVVMRIGSTPISREDLLVAVQNQNHVPGTRKMYQLDELCPLVEAWRARGLRVALTNGCFDLLHAGHVRLLEDSAAQSDRLIVALNSDASVERLKGKKRPLMPQAQRIAVLSALECVDAVVVFGEDTPLKVIEAIRPSLLIKGGDYTVSTVVGADVVQSHGGEVVLMPLLENMSTSKLAHSITHL